jgi:predicted glycosyltransferase
MGTPQTVIQKNAMTIVPSITDKDMVAVVRGAEKIIARSGYSTIMDLHALGVLEKAELHPTPGQSEQEYLSSLL